MQKERKPEQPLLQGSDHLTALYEASQNVVENKPSLWENVPTCPILIELKSNSRCSNLEHFSETITSPFVTSMLLRSSDSLCTSF